MIEIGVGLFWPEKSPGDFVEHPPSKIKDDGLVEVTTPTFL